MSAQLLTRPPTAPPDPANAHSGGFRADIEGLRALAIIAVLLYHASVPWARGGYVGVDVFFVVSGFLITGLLVREIERDSRISIPRFYVKRARRLLPAALVTLASTGVLSILVLPASRWHAIAGDVVSSALYFVNWRLAGRSTDYLAEDSAASPLQHFWSLAVEEQFYLVWPLLLAACAVFAFRSARRPRVVAGVTIGLVSLASLAASIVLTSQAPESAYFVTWTRIWELGLGSILALAMPVTLARGRTVLAGVGLGAIVLAVLTFDAATPFPSYRALLPTLGTVALLAAGPGPNDSPITRLLTARPAVWIGGLSYSLYLFHWPLVVAARHVLDGPPVAVGLAAVVASFVPAYLCHRYVENPVRRARVFETATWRSGTLGLGLAAASVVVGLAMFGLIAMREQDQPVESIAFVPPVVTAELPVEGPPPIGTSVLLPEDTTATPLPMRANSRPEPAIAWLDPSLIPDRVPSDLVPPLTAVVRDLPSVYDSGCHQGKKSTEPITCRYGTERGPVVVLVGDSHAAQWVPAMEQVALLRGWQFLSMTKSGCPFSTMVNARVGERYGSCIGWNAAALTELTEVIRPDLVITTSSTALTPLRADGSTPAADEADQLFIDGVASSVAVIRDAGIDVVVLADTPLPIGDIPECVSGNETVADCSRATTEADTSSIHRAAAEIAGVPFIDMAPWICTEDVCPPIVGNVIVWRDDDHLSATYSRLLAEPLAQILPRAFDVDITSVR